MHHLARTLVPPSARRLLPRTPKRVVVIGGGPTGLLCADRLSHHFEVTVVDSKEYFEFTPGILRALVEPSHLTRITFDYREVLERQMGVEFVLAEASAVDATPSTGTGGQHSAGSVEVSPVMRGGARTLGALERLSFDYCVVAVGVSNGIWKPRGPGEPVGPALKPPPVETVGSAYKGSIEGAVDNIEGAVQAAGAALGIGTAPGRGFEEAGEQEVEERNLEARRAGLRALRERLAGAQRAVVVGAGLVGVELAAELSHFIPRLKVTIVDGSPMVLPQLAESTREYAGQWLRDHGVSLKLGQRFEPELVKDGDVVFWCSGTRPRSAGLFTDDSVLRSNGQVRVNTRMQVLRRSGPSADSTGGPQPGAPVELEPLGQGRIFAVGDAAAVEGVPTAQMIFHGEEMAAVAVANIEAAEDIASPFAFGQGRREAEAGQPLLCCTSLGPQDGIFSTQSETVCTGVPAAIQKQLIEDTKMGALRGELMGKLLWMPVH